jgi:hypothetical protein
MALRPLSTMGMSEASSASTAAAALLPGRPELNHQWLSIFFQYACVWQQQQQQGARKEGWCMVRRHPM